MNEKPLEADLRRLVGEVTRRDATAIGEDEDLVRVLGLDSLAGLRVLAAVEKRFNIRFPDQSLGQYRTLRQLLDFISSQSN
jgi:acyl carrier protein